MTRINIIILVKVVNKTFKIYDVFSFSLKKKKDTLVNAGDFHFNWFPRTHGVY